MNIATPPHAPCITLAAQPTWPDFWREIQRVMRACEYQTGTRMLYRSVLRNLARHSNVEPARVTRQHIDRYLYRLARSSCTAHWLAMNISVLRTVFDKCCGTALLEDRRGPRRPYRLPSVLNRQETARLLTTARSPRDALLLSLVYGCGLKSAEVVSLRWEDFDEARETVQVGQREIRLPEGLLALIRAGVSQCNPRDFVFTGRRPGRPLGTRALSRIIRSTAVAAGILRPATAIILRHSYAVHQLQDGASVREVQELLGHQSIVTTLRYLACTPTECTSPAEALFRDIVPEIPAEAGHPPFSAEGSGSWFNAWLKSRLTGVFRLFRGTG